MRLVVREVAVIGGSSNPPTISPSLLGHVPMSQHTHSDQAGTYLVSRSHAPYLASTDRKSSEDFGGHRVSAHSRRHHTGMPLSAAGIKNFLNSPALRRSTIPDLTVALFDCVDQLRLVHRGPPGYVKPSRNVEQMFLAGIGVDALGRREWVV